MPAGQHVTASPWCVSRQASGGAPGGDDMPAHAVCSLAPCCSACNHKPSGSFGGQASGKRASRQATLRILFGEEAPLVGSQVTGSVDVVVDVGRWLNAKSCRNDISSALAEHPGSEELLTSLIQEFAQHLT